MKNPRRGVIYSLIISFISVVIITYIGIAYTNYVDRHSRRDLCEMVVAVDEAFKTTPANQASGQNIAKAFHNLRTKLEC